jgi:hypoxanthine phosphoribosyltransferase
VLDSRVSLDEAINLLETRKQDQSKIATKKQPQRVSGALGLSR